MSTATLTRNPVSKDPAPEGAPRRARSRELEGYRGIAAISIIVFHVCQYAFQSGGPDRPGGRFLTQLSQFEIVDILFVLSAYLLTLPYARAALDGGSALPAKAFLFRRAVRILPLYWVGILVVWSMRNATLPGDWRDLLEHLTFTQVFDQKRIFYTLGPTWSMSLEIMFYLLLAIAGPLAVRYCGRLVSRRSRVTLLLTGCAVLYLIPVVWNSTAYLVLHVSYNHWPVYFGPQSRFAAFAAGMALAVLVAARRSEPIRPHSRTAPVLVRIAGLAVVAGATWYDRPNSWGQVAFHDIAAVGWFLLLASTLLGPRGQRWARALSWRPFTLAGLISYSAYMWHEPIMQTLYQHGVTSRSVEGLPVAIPVVLAISLLVGVISYRIIERPSSKLRALRNSDGSKRDYYPELTAAAAGGRS